MQKIFLYICNHPLEIEFLFKTFVNRVTLMDFIVEILKQGLPFFLFTIALAFIAKSYLIAQMKRWDLAELFFSFFRLYNSDEIRMSSNKKRIKYMRWNNLLNYYVYIITALVTLTYIITKNIN